MRQILRVEVASYPVGLVGTYHPPHDGTAARDSGISGGRPGVLFINFGQFDRAGPANLTVQLADRLAELGYPAFRFDLPGLGDTPGYLPGYFETYWRFTEQAGCVPWTCELVAELKQQFGLPGLLLGGLCGGALTSILAAGRLTGTVRGLLLLEPPLFLTRRAQVVQAATANGFRPDAMPGSPALAGRTNERLRTGYRWICAKARGSRGGGLLRRSRKAVARAITAITDPGLPPDSNNNMVKSWRKLARAGMPMLVVCAPGESHRLIRCVIFPPTKRNRITITEIPQTNHLFTSGTGKQAVVHELDSWMKATFPP